MTLGEIGHKRWSRLDFVGNRYNIETLEDFNTENLIKYIQIIGKRNRKELITWKYKDWKNISRVYFIIKPCKIIGGERKC